MISRLFRWAGSEPYAVVRVARRRGAPAGATHAGRSRRERAERGESLALRVVELAAARVDALRDQPAAELERGDGVDEVAAEIRVALARAERVERVGVHGPRARPALRPRLSLQLNSAALVRWLFSRSVTPTNPSHTRYVHTTVMKILSLLAKNNCSCLLLLLLLLL